MGQLTKSQMAINQDQGLKDMINATVAQLLLAYVTVTPSSSSPPFKLPDGSSFRHLLPRSVRLPAQPATAAPAPPPEQGDATGLWASGLS